jgi:hypothetical protein
MKLLKIAAITIALNSLGAFSAMAQVNPGFNPNAQWGTTWGMIPFRGQTTWQGLAPGTNGQVLVSGGVGANPTWQTITGTGTVTSVAASGGTTGLSFTGSPITGAGTLTLGGVLVPANGGTGAAGSANTVFISNGSVGSWGTIGSASITDNSIVNADINTSAAIDVSKLATQPTMTVVANVTGGTAAPTTPTVTNLLDNAFGSSQGMILYRSASGWTALPPGNSGEFLRTNGTSSNIQWQAVSGALGGTVTSVATGAGLSGGPITATGTISIAAGAIPGVSTNSSASAGNVGEYVEQVVNTPVIDSSSSTPVNIASITLTAGDWDVRAMCALAIDTGNLIQAQRCSISTTSATENITVPNFAQQVMQYTYNSGSSTGMSISPIRFSLAATTTIYLVGNQFYTGGSRYFRGSVSARRIR